MAFYSNRPAFSLALGWLALSLVAGTPACATVTFYGGFTYNTFTKTGYQEGGLPDEPNAVADAGFTVTTVSKITNNVGVGTRAVRLNGTGAAPTEFAVIDSKANGTAFSIVNAANESGVTVGYGEKYVDSSHTNNRPVRWNAAGNVATQLGMLGADSGTQTNGKAIAINQSGTAVGWVENFVNPVSYSSEERAVRWDASGTAATALALPVANTEDSEAFAINDSGVIIGSVYMTHNGSNEYRALRWDPTGNVTVLGDLDSNPNSYKGTYAAAINNSGTVIGGSSKYVNGVPVGGRVVKWNLNSNTPIEFEMLGQTPDSYSNGHSSGMNNAGSAFGGAADYRTGTYEGDLAVRWDHAGHISPLARLELGFGGSTNSLPLDMNDANVIVGYATVGYNYATAWTANNTAIDLNSYLPANSGWVLTSAKGISNTGWISGEGLYAASGNPYNGYPRLFLMRVPELAVLPGDYNQNGVVDAADFIVWRTSQNRTDSLPNDDTPGVGPDDYIRWRAHFGDTFATGSSLAVTFLADIPEPAGSSLLFVAVAAVVGYRRRR